MKKHHFFDSLYSNVDLQELEISEELFVDPNSDYNNYYNEFDTILWLPTVDIIKQTPIHQNITGIVLCTKSIDIVYESISGYFGFFNSDQFSGSFKKIPDSIKEDFVKIIKQLSENGFFLSVSVPAYLFDHCEDTTKLNTTNYAITNSLLQRVFKEKHKANIQNVNIYIVGRGIVNNGLDSRVTRLAAKLLNSEVKTKRKFINSQNCEKDLTLDKFFGLCCWFVNQKYSNTDSNWLKLIKN